MHTVGRARPRMASRNLEQAEVSKAEVADLVGMTERRLRTVYLREPDRPRLLDGRNRLVVELPHPT